MSAMSRIEQLWMDGAQRDAWDEYEALFQKKYSNPQVTNEITETFFGSLLRLPKDH